MKCNEIAQYPMPMPYAYAYALCSAAFACLCLCLPTARNIDSRTVLCCAKQSYAVLCQAVQFLFRKVRWPPLTTSLWDREREKEVDTPLYHSWERERDMTTPTTSL